MSSKPIIRFAKEEDIPQLVNLCKQHAEFEKSDYNQEGKQEDLNAALFQNPKQLYCLVVELENNLIGYATYMKQYSTWDANHYIYMDCLFLNEASRGFGIGEKLVDRIKEKSRTLNCTLIQWQTPEFNVRAMKFYERIGAQPKPKVRYFLGV